MKNNIFFKIAVSGVIALLAISCVQDEEPIFQDSASARMSAAMASTRDVLAAEPGCWLMEYYPHSSQAYGGYTMFVKFTQTEVTAWGEVAESLDKSYTSYYKMTNDDGPVLSFDMFNYVLHYFSTPSGSNMNNIYGQTGLYQAYGGDFEFLVLSATASRVVLKGKRSGCTVTLTPFSGDPVEYLKQVAAAKATNFVANVSGADFTISTFSGNIGGTDYTVEIDRDMRQLIFTPSGEGRSESVAFLYTPTGVKLYKPFVSGDVEVSEITWDTTAECAKSGNITFANKMPEGWIPYSDYLGTYTLTYNDNEDWLSDPKSVEVTLVQDVADKSFIMKGVSGKYDVKVDYDIAGGNLVIMGQIVGKFGENDVFFAALYASRAASGGATWTGWRSVNYGIKTKADQESIDTDPAHFKLNFVAGPSAAGKPVNSFGMLMQKPDGSSGGWMRPANDDDHSYDDWFPFGDAYYSLFWRDMVKK